MLWITNKWAGLLFRNTLLLVASYYFYANLHIGFVGLLVYITLVNYFGGIWIISEQKRGLSGKKAVAVSILLSLLVLIFFKYAYFFNDSILLPIGLSFFTFQAMSYSIDIYRGKIKPETSFINVALFVAFFPTLLSGPIERARNLLPQLRERLLFNEDNIIAGAKLFIWGLFKKVVIADFELVNSSDQVRNYFTNLGYDIVNDTFKDTIYIRQSNEGEKLSFNWGLRSSDENHYCLAELVGKDVNSLNIRNRPTTSSKVIGTLTKGEDLLVENNNDNKKWKHCYMVNDDGKIIEGYIYNKNLNYQTSSFFSLGVFDSMTLTVAIIILVVICVFFAFGSSIFLMISAIPVGGIIIVVGCILGLLYTVYQLLEKILFEMFIINLPY